jgi:hypothetical protein
MRTISVERAAEALEQQQQVHDEAACQECGFCIIQPEASGGRCSGSNDNH